MITLLFLANKLQLLLLFHESTLSIKFDENRQYISFFLAILILIFAKSKEQIIDL